MIAYRLRRRACPSASSSGARRTARVVSTQPVGDGRNFWVRAKVCTGSLTSGRSAGSAASSRAASAAARCCGRTSSCARTARTFVQEEGECWPVTTKTSSPTTSGTSDAQGATPYPFDQAPTTAPTRRRRWNTRPASLGSSGSYLRSPSPSTRSRPAKPGRADLGEENLHGRTRPTCLLCGECNIGCNYGAKNTLDFGYLSLAKLRHGADLRTLCEVKTFAPRGRGRLQGRLRRPRRGAWARRR